MAEHVFEEEVGFLTDFELSTPKMYAASESISIGLIPPMEAGWLGMRLPKGYRGLRCRIAFIMLTTTCNPIPQQKICFDDHSLMKLVESRHYRGALWIRELTFRPRGQGRKGTKVRAIVGHRVGYTPFLGRFLGGYGRLNCNCTETPNELVLRASLLFKLGIAADIGGALVSGYRAPSAWIAIEYRISKFCNYDVIFTGSEIPSHFSYNSGNCVFDHDMRTSDRKMVDGFVGAGACKDAPRGRSQFLLSLRSLWKNEAVGR